MPIPFGYYLPSAQFALPRSYIRGICIQIDAVVTQTENEFTFPDGINPLITYHINWDSRFWEWSSDRWTLDYMLTGVYYSVSGGAPRIDVPFGCQYFLRDENLSPYVIVNPFSAAWSQFHYYELPPAPPGYWQPAFPVVPP